MKCNTIPSENYHNDSVTTADSALFKYEESEGSYNNAFFSECLAIKIFSAIPM